jgi:uncharacterized protein with PQ loop repeat
MLIKFIKPGFPQALKIFRTKSSWDISLLSRTILLVGGYLVGLWNFAD